MRCDEIDIAHEADMHRLRKEQLRAEDFDDSEWQDNSHQSDEPEDFDDVPF